MGRRGDGEGQDNEAQPLTPPAPLPLRLVLAALGSAPASADGFRAVSWSSRVGRMAGRGATGAAGTACASWTLDHGVVKIWHTDLPTATVHEPYRITACKDAPDCGNPRTMQSGMEA